MTADIDTAIAVVFTGEKYLVMKRAPDKPTFPGVWEFPAGIVEEDESPEEAVLRELEEESGLAGEIVRRGEPFEDDRAEGRLRHHPFLVEVDSRDIELSREHVEYQWIELEELHSLKTRENYTDVVEAVGISL
ncbi:MAG: NUDIX domain-containing protein [Candidatus Nanohaloarchaea archaeon]